MRSLYSWLDRVVTRRLVALWMVATILLLLGENTLGFPESVPFMRRATGGHVYLDMCAFCGSARIYGELDAFGDVGRSLQLWLMPTIDVLIPFTSAAFGSVALTYFLRGRSGFAAIALRALPLVALALDLAENAGILALLAAYPARLDALATLSGALTGLKFCAYGAVLLVVLILSVARWLGLASPGPHRPRPREARTTGARAARCCLQGRLAARGAFRNLALSRVNCSRLVHAKRFRGSGSRACSCSREPSFSGLSVYPPSPRSRFLGSSSR